MNLKDIEICDPALEPARHRAREFECFAPLFAEEDCGYSLVRGGTFKFDRDVSARFRIRARDLHLGAMRLLSATDLQERPARAAVLW